jgi:hypothetical protein
MNDECEIGTIDRGEQVPKTLDSCGRVSRIADKRELEGAILSLAVRAERETKEDYRECPQEPAR